MSLLQQALRDGRLDEIENKLFIKTKRHSKYPNLVMFKYDMINSPMGVGIVREARGMILDETNNWEIVARPFDKFFNEGEGHAATIDWSTARVQEKLDGSLMIMYWYGGQWQIATSGTPDASGQVHNHPNLNFGDLFWKIWEEKGYVVPHYNYKHFTFMFEMMTPYNRVVVPHKESKLTLIGARHKDGEETKVTSLYGFDLPVVKEFPLTSLEDVVKSFEHFDGIDQEGYVVVDDNFNRVKIKHPGYVAIHHLKGDDGPSYKKMMAIVASGESSEVLTYFPEWKPVYDEVKSIYDLTVHMVISQYNWITDLTNEYATSFKAGGGISLTPARLQKEFAVHATKSLCPDAMFKMRAGKIKTFEEYFASIPIDRALDILSKNGLKLDVP